MINVLKPLALLTILLGATAWAANTPAPAATPTQAPAQYARAQIYSPIDCADVPANIKFALANPDRQCGINIELSSDPDYFSDGRGWSFSSSGNHEFDCPTIFAKNKTHPSKCFKELARLIRKRLLNSSTSNSSADQSTNEHKQQFFAIESNSYCHKMAYLGNVKSVIANAECSNHIASGDLVLNSWSVTPLPNFDCPKYAASINLPAANPTPKCSLITSLDSPQPRPKVSIMDTGINKPDIGAAINKPVTIYSETRTDFDQVMSSAKVRIGKAHKRALADDPTLTGNVRVRVKVSGDGRVTDALVVSSDLGGDALEGNIVSIVKGLSFAAGFKDFERSFTYSLTAQ